MTKFPDLFNDLSEPFPRSEIKILPKGKGLQYVTARTVMNRLDAVLGPENWWDEYVPGADSVLCRLTVLLPDGRHLTKSDAGGYAGMADAGDDDKSGYSDAFKRAAVKFGVGRHLYNDGIPTFEATNGHANGQETYQDPTAHHAKNHDNQTGHGSGAYASPKTTDAYRDWCKAFCEARNGQWTDKWTDGRGELDDRVMGWKNGEIINPWQLSGHLVKWARGKKLIQAPENHKPAQADKLAAVAWERHQGMTEDESIRYVRDQWKEIWAKLHMTKVERPTPLEAEDESQDADDVLDAAYGSTEDAGPGDGPDDREA